LVGQADFYPGKVLHKSTHRHQLPRHIAWSK